MRFRSLDLIAFGHFSGQSLRFADAPGALDIVYGDNEAGKSTSLRAVGSFLYGIPVRTNDDFVHPKPTLRIGATLSDSDGRDLRLIRRKGSKETLRDSDDVPLDDGLIERMLGGLDRELFEQMYALSRETLERGAADLLNGNGSLGEALFGASLGLAGISNVLKVLESDAAAIFKPGGSNPQLNTALSRLEGLRRRGRELELRPADYLAHESALGEARAERERLDAELAELASRQRRTERDRQLLPLVAARAQLLEKIAALGEVAILAPTARDERSSAKRELDRALAEIERAEARLEILRASLDALAPSDRLLGFGGEIRTLHEEISAHQKAARDLPGIRAAQRAAVREAEALLAQTHPERTLDQIGDLRPTITVRSAIASLGDDHVRLTEAKRVADERLERMQRALVRARGEVDLLPPPDDVALLRAVLAAARKLGDLEGELSEEQSRHAAAREQLLADVSALPAFTGTSAELAALPVPGGATVGRFVEEFERLAASERPLSIERAHAESELANCREQLVALELAGAVPSESDLEESRAHRDRGWGLLREAFATGEVVDRAQSAQAAADAYELSVREADDLADRLRRESDRVAQKASLDAAVSRFSGELVELARQAELAGVERGRLDEQWRAVWRAAGIEPLAPPEMREWLADHARLVTQAATLRADEGRIAGRQASVATHRKSIARELVALGQEGRETATLAALIGIGEELVEDRSGRAQHAKAARERMGDLEHQTREAAADVAQAAAALADWKGAWADELKKLGLPAELSPDQARTVVETLIELFVKVEMGAKEKTRIDGIERDARAFAAAVAAIVQQVADELATLAPDQALLRLDQLLVAAQAEATRAVGISEQIAELEVSIAEADERRQIAHAELDRLIRDARCANLDELLAAEERSTSAFELKARLEEAEAQMTGIGSAAPGELATQVEQLELHDLERELQQAEQLIADLADRRREVDEEVGRQRAQLNEIAGGDEAAEAVAAAEATKADVREQAEQYARLTIAAVILRRQIEEFRERSHGPLLARASYFFSKVTCGEYSGLVTGFEGANVVLLGRRRNGREVTVEQMSEGTRDPLYLALRLAALEQKLQRTEPLPLIVDDLFVSFDDHRAAAGFEALAEIAERTQVVFFTHHQHLVEIARKTLPPEQCLVQELSDPPVASAEAA